MNTLKVGVPREVLAESWAGRTVWFPDTAYSATGTRMVNGEDLNAGADVLLCAPPPAALGKVRSGRCSLACYNR